METMKIKNAIRQFLFILVAVAGVPATVLFLEQLAKEIGEEGGEHNGE